MSNNAMWWVTATDKVTGLRIFLSLMSPDLSSPSKAKKRARDKARERWAKKGFKPVNVSAECVG